MDEKDCPQDELSQLEGLTGTAAYGRACSQSENSDAEQLTGGWGGRDDCRSTGGGRIRQLVASKYQYFIVFAFLGALLCALVMALLPKPPNIPGNPSDKVQHMLAFAALAALGSQAYPRTPLLKVGLGLAVLGAVIELMQAIPILNGEASFVDFAADCAGIGVVLLVLGRLLSQQR